MSLALTLALFLSPAHAGTCPSDADIWTGSSAKTGTTVVLGELAVELTELGLVVDGFGDGDDRSLVVEDGVATLRSASGVVPTGGEVLSILDRGEAGDNIIFGTRGGDGLTADDAVLALSLGAHDLAVLTTPNQLALQLSCDDGSTLGLLVDGEADDLTIARLDGEELEELGTVLALGTGWSFPPTLHGLDLDGSVKTVEVGAVALDSLSVVNGAYGTSGLKVGLAGADVATALVENAARLTVDGASRVEELEVVDVASVSIDGTVLSYIGETEKNCDGYKVCATK